MVRISWFLFLLRFQAQLITELIIPERIVHAPANGALPIQETCQIGGFVLTIKEAIVEELD